MLRLYKLCKKQTKEGLVAENNAQQGHAEQQNAFMIYLMLYRELYLYPEHPSDQDKVNIPILILCDN